MPAPSIGFQNTPGYQSSLARQRLGEALTNVPRSLYENYIEPYVHPIDTLRATVDLPAGAIREGFRKVASPETFKSYDQYLFGTPEQAERSSNTAIGLKDFAASLSTEEGRQRAFVEDPVGIAAMLTPFGIIKKAEKEGIKLSKKAGKIGRVGAPTPEGEPRLGRIGAPEPPPSPKIRAWHGSPHDFDRFELGRIGTGEGAQAYGHGLYFAENDEVARIYRDNISASQDPMANMNMAIERLNDQYMKKRLTPEMLAEQLETNPNYRSIAFLKNDPDAMRDFHIIVQGHNPDGTVTEEAIRAMRRLESNPNIPQKSKGKMYEVDINADPAHFLDWDKPLSEQSEHVRQTLKENWLAHPETHAGQTGEQIYAANELGVHQPGEGHLDRQRVSEKLREAGIPGIKYLDQGSRGLPQNLPDNPMANEARQFLEQAGGDVEAARRAWFDSNPYARYNQPERDEIEKIIKSGGQKSTRNYVVFDDKIINIVGKLGIAGALAAGAINQMQADQLTEQGYQ